MTEHTNEVTGTLHLDGWLAAPERYVGDLRRLAHRLEGSPATPKQILASLNKRVGETGYFLVNEDGDPVDEGSWDAQNAPAFKAWVEVDMDPNKARRLLGLVPNIVIVNTDYSFSGGSAYDGLSQETAAIVEQHELADTLRDALATAHLAAWKAALIEAGYEPREYNEWEIDTEVARGHGFSRDQIVDWDDNGDPYWQQAWDEVDSEAITKEVITQARRRLVEEARQELEARAAVERASLIGDLVLPDPASIEWSYHWAAGEGPIVEDHKGRRMQLTEAQVTEYPGTDEPPTAQAQGDVVKADGSRDMRYGRRLNLYCLEVDAAVLAAHGRKRAEVRAEVRQWRA